MKQMIAGWSAVADDERGERLVARVLATSVALGLVGIDQTIRARSEAVTAANPNLAVSLMFL
jgi:hypothetical protein